MQSIHIHSGKSVIYCLFIILTAIDLSMFRQIPKSPRNQLSPRNHQLRPYHKQHNNTDQEYQLKVFRSTKKKDSSVSKVQPTKEPNAREKKFIRRKLSFKRVSDKERATGSSPGNDQQINAKENDKWQQNERLALQIEYNIFPRKNSPLGEGQFVAGESEKVNKKIRRIRSSSIFDKEEVQQNQITPSQLSKVKQYNTELRQRKEQALLRLDNVTAQAEMEKRRCESELVSYQRQICALKHKISEKKIGVAHLFHYEKYDPCQMAIQPIVEVDNQSSKFQSILKESEVRELHYESRTKSVRISKNSDTRDRFTETTGAASRQDYGQVDDL